MNQRGSEKKPTGRVNTFRVLAGGYLIYIAFNMIRDLKETSMPAVGIGGALVFAVFGGWLLRREWQAYRYGAEHIDDPSTWSDEPEELPAQEEEADGGAAAEIEAAEEAEDET